MYTVGTLSVEMLPSVDLLNKTISIHIYTFIFITETKSILKDAIVIYCLYRMRKECFLQSWSIKEANQHNRQWSRDLTADEKWLLEKGAFIGEMLKDIHLAERIVIELEKIQQSIPYTWNS